MTNFNKSQSITINEFNATIIIKIDADNVVTVTTNIPTDVGVGVALSETFDAAEVLNGTQLNNLRTFITNLVRRTIQNAGYV